MKIEGRCHCGQITYEAEVNPAAVLVCHCTDCQMLSGSAFRTVVLTRPGGFRLLSGHLKTYVKVGDGGTRRAQTFCPECGSPIYAAAEGGPEPKVYSLRLGTCAQRAELKPVAQIWCRSAMPWVGELPAIARYADQADVAP